MKMTGLYTYHLYTQKNKGGDVFFTILDKQSMPNTLQRQEVY
jgi:hypothetical protein